MVDEVYKLSNYRLFDSDRHHIRTLCLTCSCLLERLATSLTFLLGETLAVSGQSRGQASSDCPVQGLVATDPDNAVSDADASDARRVPDDAQDTVHEAQGCPGH